MKNKTILIPTDFSENAQNAINYAISMFSDEDPDYILLNSYRIIPVGAEEYITDMADFEGMSKQGLEQTIKTIEKNFPHKKLNIEIVSKLGYPVEVMDKIVKRKNVDLAVMGTKGASGLREALIGSNTADAIKTLSCPVLAVPGNSTFSPLKNIAFAADFKDIDKEVLLNPMLEIAKKFKAELLVVHVEHQGVTVNVDEALQGMRLHDFFSGIPHLFQEVEHDDPAEGIEAFIKTHTVDLLVSVARKHGFWEKLFRGSITEKLAMHTRIPMLALQYK